MRTARIEWRIVTSPPRRIRSARHAFLARREARTRLALEHDNLAKHARKARAVAANTPRLGIGLAGAINQFWTRQIIKHTKAARVQRSMIEAEQAERERYF
jgi:hypothetical protein